MSGNGWGAINNLINQFFSFLKSRVVVLIILLGALYFGYAKLEELKEIAKAVGEIFK